MHTQQNNKVGNVVTVSCPLTLVQALPLRDVTCDSPKDPPRYSRDKGMLGLGEVSFAGTFFIPQNPAKEKNGNLGRSAQ